MCFPCIRKALGLIFSIKERRKGKDGGMEGCKGGRDLVKKRGREGKKGGTKESSLHSSAETNRFLTLNGQLQRF